MQFDSFDRKIKEAADHHHPAYDENAWKKMEKLLDEHLPQKKDKRRIIFFLLFFLFLGGGSYFLINKFSGNKKEITSQNTISKQNTSVTSEKNSTSGEANSSTSITGKQKKNNQSNIEEGFENKTTSSTNPTILQVDTERTSKTFANRQKVSGKKGIFNKNAISNDKNLVIPTDNSQPENRNNEAKISPVINNDKDQNHVSKDATVTRSTVDDVNMNTNKTNSDNKNDSTKKAESAITKTETKKSIEKNKKPARQKNGQKFLALSASIGPDVSKAGGSAFGQMDLAYGASASYTLNKFTLRSGFYVAKKIYDAGPNDYKLGYNLPPNVKLENVDANCKVYEIPVNIFYNFPSRGKTKWYAGAGLSSYIMKEEQYTNSYKNTSTGQNYSYNYYYDNKNKHYFSVLDLSGGFTRNLNDRFSLSVEPYLKIPLQGVGQGKVHLNSTGILFSVNVKPFQKNKKIK